MYNMYNQIIYGEREGKKKTYKYKILIIRESGRKGYKFSLYSSYNFCKFTIILK